MSVSTNPLNEHIQEFSDWLAHPLEHGEHPSKIWHIATYERVILPAEEPYQIHLLGYEMPNGYSGRGFTGYITWAFISENLNAIPDEDIVIAYTGWAFLFPGLQQGKFAADFSPSDQERQFLAQIEQFEDLEITRKYRIGDVELFEYCATEIGQKIRGCGHVGKNLYYTDDEPHYALPTVYFLLGYEQND